jgi:hypothetical protein
VSERDEAGMDDLERRLDAAFASTRPRRGFDDELWARLQARRPWWRRLGGGLRPVQWAALATSSTAVVLAVVAVGLVWTGRPHAGVSTAPTSGASGSASAQQAAPPSGAAGASAGDRAALPFGPLPAPAAAGVPQVVRPGGPSPLPAGAGRVTAPAATAPQPAPGLPVYRYDPAAGPPDGTILETNALPSGLTAGIYPSRPPAEAIADATAGSAAGQQVVLTGSRLVYVAVVSGGQAYLEPAYLYTGTAGGAPAQLLVSALAPSALR